MIEHELILLGLLKESPMHGYEIKKKIEDILFLFAGVNLRSIYYPLRVLEKDGLVEKKVNKQGRRPQRFTYALTRKGEVRFKQLLNKSFLDFKRPQFSLDISIYFLQYMKPHIVKRRLRARMHILKKLFTELEGMARPLKRQMAYPLLRILQHNLQMVKTEFNFLSHLIGTI